MMKKIRSILPLIAFLLAPTGAALALCSAPIPASVSGGSSLTNRAFGFASGVTGGSIPCTATNQATLISCASRPGALVHVTADILGITAPVMIASNVTINCHARRITANYPQYSGASLQNFGIFNARGAQNVDIGHCYMPKSTTVNDAQCSNPDTVEDVIPCGTPIILRGARDVYIHNMDLSECGRICIENWNNEVNNVGVVSASDNVTIAYSRFADSTLGIANGFQNGIPDIRRPPSQRVTFAYNLCDRVFRRCPRGASYAQVHVYGNIVRDWSRRIDGVRQSNCTGANLGYGPLTIAGAELLIEKNVFDPAGGPCTDPISVATDVARGQGNVLSDNPALSVGTVFAHPGYRMPRIFASLAEVSDYVTRNVGPRP